MRIATFSRPMQIFQMFKRLKKEFQFWTSRLSLPFSMLSRCLKNQPVFTEEGDGDSVLARSFLRDQNIENMLTVSNENSILISSENTAGSLKDGSHYS